MGTVMVVSELHNDMDKKPKSDAPSRTLKTVETAIEVIKGLEYLDGAGVTELAEHLGMSKSKTYHHLATLRYQDFLVKNGDQYELSLQLLLLGEYIRNQHILYKHGRDEIQKLGEETGEYAHLFTEQHGIGINLYKFRGPKAIGDEYQKSKLQRPDQLHSTATGKAILGFLPRDRVHRILDNHGLPRQTENTLTNRDALFDELDKIREQGYAFNDEEEVEGLRAVGAPILGPGDEVLGSISVSGPTSRLHGEEFRDLMPEKVVDTANLIEVNINMARRNFEHDAEP